MSDVAQSPDIIYNSPPLLFKHGRGASISARIAAAPMPHPATDRTCSRPVAFLFVRSRIRRGDGRDDHQQKPASGDEDEADSQRQDSQTGRTRKEEPPAEHKEQPHPYVPGENMADAERLKEKTEDHFKNGRGAWGFA